MTTSAGRSGKGAHVRKAELFIAVVAVAGLSGCVSSSPGPAAGGFQPSPVAARSDWQWKADPDKITGEVSPSISVATSQVQITGATGFHAASAAVDCINKVPSIMIVWDFPVGSQGSSAVAYRFDGRPGHEIGDAQFYNLQSQIIANPSEVKAFLDEAQSANSLLVRVSSVVGIAEAQFATRGGAAMIQRFLEACPLTSPSGAKRT